MGITITLFIPLLAIILNIINIFKLTEIPFSSTAIPFVIKGICADYSYVLLLFSLFLLLKSKKLFNIIFSALITILLSLIIIDFVHFSITYERFSWSVLHDLNSISLNATLDLKIYIIIAITGLALLLFLLFTLKTIKNLPRKKQTTLILFALTFSAILTEEFLPDVKDLSQGEMSAPNFIGKQIQMNHLKKVSKGIFLAFFERPFISEIEALANPLETGFQQNKKKKEPYSPTELAELKDLGLIIDRPQINTQQAYDKIIVLVLEGMANSYIHQINNEIPQEATPFLNRLIKQFPNSKNYITSDAPTIKGLYSMCLSRLPYAPKLSLTLNHKSIFKAFKEQLKGETLFLRGVSKFYGGENILLRDLFGVDKLITKEELEKYLPPISVDSWGYHNLTVYNELVKLLKNRNQSQPILAMVKTIDLHQPPYYCGLPKKDLPDSVRNHPSPIIPSIYWIDYCLKSLFKNLEKNKLLTDKTLVVITSDHHPLPGWGHKELVKSKLPVHRERLPLIFVSKNLKPFKNFNSNKLSCQLDLAPTLCELAGLKVPETFMGQSIISGLQTGRALSMHQKSMFIEREEKQEATIISIPPAKEQRSSIKKWFNNLF